ncbi:MAG: hypothetical protein NTZ32_27250 [Planctomycetales bacterium]|nr:hypothetical protein [Planctomycetales bacterium]
MELQELDLAVGDVVQIGEYTVTVIDIENDDVTLRVDQSDAINEGEIGSTVLRPR